MSTVNRYRLSHSHSPTLTLIRFGHSMSGSDLSSSDSDDSDCNEIDIAEDSDCNEIVIAEDSTAQRQREVAEARRQKKVVVAATTEAGNTEAPKSIVTSLKTKGRPRKSKERSNVWDHYEKHDHPLWGVVDGVKKVVGHYKKAHCRVNVESGQQVFSSNSKGCLVSANWTQDRCVEAATHMIVVDELPFSHIEKDGFRYFFSVAVPMFKVPGRAVIVSTFLRMYDAKKEELRKELKSHCVSLTTDTWTSCQNINYMAVTAHFIDKGWNMHKRVLAFCVIPNHEGVTIGQILEGCIRDWSIDKVLCISVDIASANKVVIDYVRKKMCSWQTRPILGGRFMHVRCLAHIINIIVRSGLKRMENSVIAIRNAMRYVRGSGARLDEFQKCVEKENVPCKRVCILDVPTRWNSTYLMLDTAWRLRKAFDRLYADDVRFRNYFTEDEVEDEDEALIADRVPIKGVKRIGPPSEEDWNNAAVHVKFLKVFCDVTLDVSASLKPTAHKAFQDIVTVEAELLSATGIGPESSEADKVMYEMAVQMKAKYNKYFGSLDSMNQLFLVALVLDPRYKLRYMERVCKTQLNLTSEEIKKKSVEVKQLLVELCDLYGQNNGVACGGKRKAPSDIISSTFQNQGKWRRMKPLKLNI